MNAITDPPICMLIILPSIVFPENDHSHGRNGTPKRLIISKSTTTNQPTSINDPQVIPLEPKLSGCVVAVYMATV